jgi:hypothetical protein
MFFLEILANCFLKKSNSLKNELKIKNEQINPIWLMHFHLLTIFME